MAVTANSKLNAGNQYFIPFVIPATELGAGTGIELVAPFAGYIDELDTTVQTAIVTGGAITVKTGAALAVTVAGISNTHADAAPVGNRINSIATRGSSTRYVAEGERISITPASAFNGGGAINGVLTIATTDTSPALPAKA